MTNDLQVSQGNVTQLHLSTPLPDTQNETARNQTKEDRAALMDRLRQLLVNLQTGRFDPSEVASDETSKAISKFFPACFAHPEEQDAAFELLRNLMTASTNRLRECYVSSTTRNDDVSRPIWLYAKEKEAEGEALQSVFTNTLWAILAYLDSLPNEDTQGADARKSAKESTARAFFPLLFKLLSSSDVTRLIPQSLRDALAIILDCVEESEEVKKILERSGLPALANVLASCKDHPAWSLAYNIAGNLLSTSEEKNQKIAKVLFPVKAQKDKHAEKTQSDWSKLPCDTSAIKKLAPVLSARLAKMEPKQLQPFYTTSSHVRVLNHKISLDARKQTNYRDYLIALNERSLSCIVMLDQRAEVLDIRLDTVLSLETDKEGSVTIRTSVVPTTTTEMFKKGQIPAGSIETVLHLKLADAERLQDMLKYRYMPNLTRKPLTKPGKVSLSQGQIRAGEPSSPSSDDGPEKRDARVVEVAKNIESGSPPENGSDHDHQNLTHQDLNGNVPPPPPQVRKSADKSKPVSIPKKPPSDRHENGHPNDADTTQMSLDDSTEDDLPDAYTSAKDHGKMRTKSTSADQKSVTKPVSKRSVTVTAEIPTKKHSPPSTTAKPTAEHSAGKVPTREVRPNQVTDSELSALSSSSSEDDDGDQEEDNYVPPTKKTAKAVRKDIEAVKPAKKKGRDSGFDDQPLPKKTIAKRKASPASEDDGTDYDDLSKAGIEEKKLKAATPRRGRPAVRGRGTGRGTARGKATSASTAKPRSRKEDSIEYVLPDKEEKEVTQSEGRVTRSSRAPAKSAVQSKPKAKKVVDIDVSDEEEPAARPVKRKKADQEAEKAAEDALDEFFNNSKSSTKVAAMKSNKVITSFSQLVDKNRNPLAPARSKPDHRRAPVELGSQSGSPPSKTSNKQAVEVSASRKLIRRTRSPSHVVNPAFSSPKGMGEAIDELLQDSQPEDQEQQREQSYAYEPLAMNNEMDTNDDDIRNYTTLYDENIVNNTTDCGDNDFFADDNVDGPQSQLHKSHAQPKADQNSSTELKPQQNVGTVVERPAYESHSKGRNHTHDSTQPLVVAAAAVLNAITGKAEDTSMEIDDIVAESNGEKSRLSAAGVITEESHHTERRVQTSVTVRKRPASDRAASEELPEMLVTRHVEKNEQIQARRVKTTLPAPAKDVPKRLIEAFQSTQVDVDSQIENPRPARSSRRTRPEKGQTAEISREVISHARASNKSFSPVKTSTPSRGYDQKESQTQMLEDPLQAFESQQAEARQVAEAEKIAHANKMAEEKKIAEARTLAEAKEKAEARKVAEDRKKAEARKIAESKRIAEAKKKAEELEIDEETRLAEAEKLAEEQKRFKLAAARQAKEDREMAQHRAKQKTVQHEEGDEPDKLVDLSVELALLLVKNHRKSLNIYKASKNVGIDNIINIVASGCSEADQLDVKFLQGLKEHNDDTHKVHAELASPLDKLLDRIRAEKTKVTKETARLNTHKELSQVKLGPDLFSNFKS